MMVCCMYVYTVGDSSLVLNTSFSVEYQNVGGGGGGDIKACI